MGRRGEPRKRLEGPAGTLGPRRRPAALFLCGCCKPGVLTGAGRGRSTSKKSPSIRSPGTISRRGWKLAAFSKVSEVRAGESQRRKALLHLLGDLHAATARRRHLVISKPQPLSSERRASGSTPQMKDPHVDKANAQASMMAAHSKYVTRLLETLQDVDASEKPRCS